MRSVPTVRAVPGSNDPGTVASRLASPAVAEGVDLRSDVAGDPIDADRRAGIDGRDVAVIAGTAALWLLVMALAARAAGMSVWSTATWGRWDTGHYLQIAESGYSFGHCNGVPNRGPTDYCGNSGWFPGYPYLVRFTSWSGMSFAQSGRLISTLAMLTAWSVLWLGFLRRRPFVVGVLGMALAAVFPAGVYSGAIFPISTMLAAVLLMLAFLDRRRWLLAGCCGAVAAVVYPSGVLVGLVAFAPLTAASVGDLRQRCRAALLVGVPIALGYGAVLLNYQRAVGTWDAWFKTQASYELGATIPIESIVRQIGHLGDDPTPAIVGVQTILVVAMVVGAAWVVATRKRDLSLGERGAAVLVLGLWLLPLTLGSDLSLYRAESLLLPIVILLVHLRPAIVAAYVAAGAPVAYLMAQLFFDGTLI